MTLFLENNKPDRIVNCAAYTAVDLAETETALNYKVNAIGPQVLGKCAAMDLSFGTALAFKHIEGEDNGTNC